jgi:small conductance mechanosensitive channel
MIVTVAFLAREVLGDVVKGATLLLERPFEANDVVRVGEVEGVVARIGARCTVIRDFHGGIHHVPNGRIHALSNLTSAWSRASADVRIAYAEDIERVIEALREAVVDVRADPTVGGLIADGEEEIGIDRYEDGGAILRVSLKTRPLREVLVEETIERRIAHRLGALQIATDLCPRRGRSEAPRID